MKRLLLYVHYDRDGRLDDHILYLLNTLRPFVAQAVVIANSPLSDTDMDRLSPVADRVIRRQNRGFDFGAWGEVLPEYREQLVKNFDSLLLVNGSCFGPLFPLNEMFDKMAETPCDFWGVTEHTAANGVPAHLQSYFMEIRKPMLQSEAFHRFFREVGAKCTDFESAVRHGEIGFSKAMKKAGFHYRCYVEIKDTQTAPNAGIQEAFSRNCADDLIRRYRLPLLKIKAFGQVASCSIYRAGSIFRALKVSGSSYPANLITDYLRRTAPLSWQKNLPETLLTADRGDDAGITPLVKLGVMFHCFRPEHAAKIKPYIANIPADFDLLVTSPAPETENAVRKMAADIPGCHNVFFSNTPNRGRDVAPWLCGFPAEQHLRYDVILKLHVKTSPQMPEAFTADWQDYLYDNLAGSRALIGKILRAFTEEPALGTVFPPYPPVVTLQCPTAYAGHPDDAAAAKQILHDLQLDPPQETGLPVFSPGTMFWYRPQALKSLLQKNWTPEDFPPEPLPNRGTAAHAMERLVPYIAQAEGFYFRQSIHTDRLAEAFRTMENRVIYHAPTLKQAVKQLLESIKDSLQYRLRGLFR